ncbi:Zinc finger, SWIM-type [Sesbania bispinosa]|nr:Zinc finger, SWIM-type [Sesbania bispinosa]
MDDSMVWSGNNGDEGRNAEGLGSVPLHNEDTVDNDEANIPINEDYNDYSNANSSENEDVDIYKIDDEIDLKRIELISLSESDLKKFHFSSLKMGFQFYNDYAQKRGFAARKWNIVKNKMGEITQQTFVCFKEGYRQKKHIKRTNRKRKPRAMTSHDMLSQQHVGMLPAHRKMDECDLIQMNNMRDAGIGVTQIYGLAANQSGGYERMAFRKRDMYNEIERQKRIQVSDVRAVFAYLRELQAAMRGKLPSSVITDGDLAMRNAIRSEFPYAHHRLCAWHLLRNATSNISNPRFTSKLRRCMLGDYDVGRFRSKWEELVNEFDLHGNQWVRELYDKRKMWATTHIRGNFFASFRTTSRCEGMHSQVGRRVLERARGLKVVSCEQTPNCVIYIVSSMRTSQSRQWYVSLGPTGLLLKCSCLRMESMGIPCEHVCKLDGKSGANLDLSKQVVRELLEKLRESGSSPRRDAENVNDGVGGDRSVRDPKRVRTKGCESRPLSGGAQGNRRTACFSICQGPGHNKKTCPLRKA